MSHRDHDEQQDALAALHSRLADALARTQLSKSQLARQARLGRTTVHAAFQQGAPAPSATTVAAIARVLRLPAADLLELRRTADRPPASGPEGDQGPGRPIGQWDPHDLEVHPAGGIARAVSRGRPVQMLPGYVERAHDRTLAEVVQEVSAGRSRMVVLVGSSSTGKTRACWEAVRPLAAHGWRLWHPFDPTRAEAALADLSRVGPRTVLWLNEAQHYLGHHTLGEQIASAVHTLLTSPDHGPVLVLGTLWPEYADQYAAPPRPRGPDPHSQVRELLAGRTVTVPDAFDDHALAACAVLAQDGDLLLADALTRAHQHGRLTQDLAGAPALLDRYEHGTPAARALLQAAMDARRLGAGLLLPQSFLADAAVDYLTDHDFDELTDGWADTALAALARPVHGKQAALRRTNPRPVRRPPGAPASGIDSAEVPRPVFRLADYLEQHGRITRRPICPPASFWLAAHTHLADPEDLAALAAAAGDRHRLQWAHYLQLKATAAIARLTPTRVQGAEQHSAQAASAPWVPDEDSYSSLVERALKQEEEGDRQGAEALLLRAATRYPLGALAHLSLMWERAGDSDRAEAVYQQAADAGHGFALAHQVRRLEEAGELRGAAALIRRADGNPDTLSLLAVMREETGDRRGAEALARQAAHLGDAGALAYLSLERKEAGDQQSAEILAREAAAAGYVGALADLAVVRTESGSLHGLEAIAREAADSGEILSNAHGTPFAFLASMWPYGLEPDGTPTPPWSPSAPPAAAEAAEG